MDLTFKKVELIEWLTRLQDESTLNKIEALRKETVLESYKSRTPRNTDELLAKLKKSDTDIKEGRVFTQEEVEKFLNT